MSANAGDVRSGRIALIAHCILNQNSIVPGLARRPAMIKEVIDVLNEYGVGIIQLPCPETLHSGLRRFWQVKEQYSSTGFRRVCKRLVRLVGDYVEEYVRNGYELVLILGVSGSPSCGIFSTSSSHEWLGDPRRVSDHRRVRGRGVFMEELLNTLKSKGLLKPKTIIMDFNYSDIEGSIESLRRKLNEYFNR